MTAVESEDGGERRHPDDGVHVPLTRPRAWPPAGPFTWALTSPSLVAGEVPVAGLVPCRGPHIQPGTETDHRIDAGTQQDPVECRPAMVGVRKARDQPQQESGKASMISRNPRATTRPSRSWDRMRERTTAARRRIPLPPPCEAAAERPPVRAALPDAALPGVTLPIEVDAARRRDPDPRHACGRIRLASSFSRTAGRCLRLMGSSAPATVTLGRAAASFMWLMWPRAVRYERWMRRNPASAHCCSRSASGTR